MNAIDRDDTEKKIAEVLELSKPVSDCPECGGLGEIRSLGSRQKCECLYIRLKTLKRELDRRDEENRKLQKELDKQVEIGFSFECQLQSAQQEIERLKQERAELIEELRTGLMHHGSWSADEYAAYMRDILRGIGVTVE